MLGPAGRRTARRSLSIVSDHICERQCRRVLSHVPTTRYARTPCSASKEKGYSKTVSELLRVQGLGFTVGV